MYACINYVYIENVDMIFHVIYKGIMCVCVCGEYVCMYVTWVWISKKKHKIIYMYVFFLGRLLKFWYFFSHGGGGRGKFGRIGATQGIK